MGKNRYYAVRKGKVPGIYESWDECKLVIDGFSNAEYKSFGSKEEALAYMDKRDIAEIHKKKAQETDAIIAYVDGSYSDIVNRYSYGCILILPSGEILKSSGSGSDPKALSTRNVAGELQGTMYAVKKAYDLGYRRIIIRHDYIGIAKWVSGEWKAKDETAKRYVDYLNKYKNKMEIFFDKVIAHSGDKYNEEADAFAKAELDKFKLSSNIEQNIDRIVSQQNINTGVSQQKEYLELFYKIMTKKSKSKNNYSIVLKNIELTESKLKKFAKELWKLDKNLESDIDSTNVVLNVETNTIDIRIKNKTGDIKKYLVDFKK